MPRPCPGAKCCEGEECEFTLTVCVLCGIDGQDEIGVTVEKDDVVVASGATDETGCWSTPLDESGDYTITVSDESGTASRTVTLACEDTQVTFEGKSCDDCIADGPPSITLSTPYGDVTMNKTQTSQLLPGYQGFGTIPGVPNVRVVDCTQAHCPMGPPATHDLPVMYELECFFGTAFRLWMKPSVYRFPTGGFPEFDNFLAYCSPLGEACEGMRWGGHGLSTDFAGIGGCVACDEATLIEFVIDYDNGGLGGQAGQVVTVSGLG